MPDGKSLKLNTRRGRLSKLNNRRVFSKLPGGQPVIELDSPQFLGTALELTILHRSQLHNQHLTCN